MRIAIVSDYYYPQLGGITEQVHGQATALTRRGHQVTVITPKVMVTPSTVDGANLPGRDFDVVRVGTAWPAYGNGAETLVSIVPRISLRLRQSQHNAQGLAEWLSRHPRVATVRYPGLPAHPTHEVARRVLQGFGSMISFDLDGSAEEADRLCQRMRLIRHATSLGAVESIIERRAALTGQQHLPPSLLRLSVGIEHLDDLKADLEQALR